MQSVVFRLFRQIESQTSRTIIASHQKPELEINAAELAEYADVAAQKTVERAETEKVRRAVRTIGDIFFTRENMRGRLLAEYNEMGQEPTKTWDQIRLGFLKLGYSIFTIKLDYHKETSSTAAVAN